MFCTTKAHPLVTTLKELLLYILKEGIVDAPPNTPFLLIIGRYCYDENPFMGSMANVNMWSRTMDETELAERTRYIYSY